MTWETVPLGRLASLNPRSDSNVEPGTFLGMADVSENGTTSIGTRVENGDLKSGYTPFRDRDILVAKITPCFENGKIAQAILPTKLGWGSTEFHVVRPHADVLHDRYALHYLRTSLVRANGTSRMTGSAGQRRVPVSFLQSLEIPLPPLPDQRRIAAILDGADALRLTARRQVDALNELEDRAFDDLVGDREQDSRATLGDLVEELRYGTSVKSGSTGLPVLRIPNITGRAIDATETKTVELPSSETARLRLNERDVLFVRSNGNPDVVGRCAAFASMDEELRVGTDWVYASYLIRARLRPGVEPEAVVALARSPRGRRHLRSGAATSAGQYNINTGVLRSMPAFSPLSRGQTQFGDHARSIAAERARARHRVNELDLLFASLQYRAFRGEL